MRVLHIKVGKEDDLQSVAQCRVRVHGFADCVDEFDDALRQEVAGRSFAAEDEAARGHIRLRIASQSQIECENVEHSEMLPLVFVDALYLHVEERLRFDSRCLCVWR